MSTSSAQSSPDPSPCHTPLDVSGMPEVLLAISVSASRFSASFNDDQASTLRLIKRPVDKAPPSNDHTRPEAPLQKCTTGAAIVSGASCAALVAVETAPARMAVEGARLTSGQGTLTAMRHTLAADIARRLGASSEGTVVHDVAPNSDSFMGEEVLTYALGHTQTGKTTFLMGPPDQEETDAHGDTMASSAAGLFELVLRQVFAPGLHEAAPVVALSVLEVSEPPHLTEPLPLPSHRTGAHLGSSLAHPTAVDLLSGRRGPLFRALDHTTATAEGAASPAFMADPADIPAARYVQPTSATEAMTVLHHALTRAQSWPPLTAQDTSRTCLDHLLITLIIATHTSGAERTGVWKLWDLCGPPAVPLTTQTPETMAVPPIFWGWPLAARQRLHALDAFLPSERHCRALTTTLTAATAIVATACQSASVVVVLGGLLYDACANTMNASTLQHLADWQHAVELSQDALRASPTRAQRRAENIEAAARVVHHFAVPASQWRRQCAREAEHAQHVAVHDARHQQLVDMSHTDEQFPLHGDVHTAVDVTPPDQLITRTKDAVDATEDVPPEASTRPLVANACALYYTSDLSALSALAGAAGAGKRDTVGSGSEAVALPHVASSSCGSSQDAHAPTNWAAHAAARAATRYEADSHRRFPRRLLASQLTEDHEEAEEAETGEAGEAEGTQRPLALTETCADTGPDMNASPPRPTSAASPSLDGSPLARSSPPPPPMAAQTEKPDALARRAQQQQRAHWSCTESSGPSPSVVASLFPTHHLTIHSEASEEETAAMAVMGDTDTWTEAEWHQYIQKSLAAQGPSDVDPDTSLNALVQQVVAPLVRQCVQSAHTARETQAACAEARARTQHLAEKVEQLEEQLALMMQKQATPLKAPAPAAVERGRERELDSSVSAILPCHDRSLSASQSLSVSATAAPQRQLADILARSVVRGQRLSKATAARQPGQPDVFDTDAQSGAAMTLDEAPLFSIEMIADDVSTTSAQHDTLPTPSSAELTPKPASPPPHHHRHPPFHRAPALSGESVIHLELERVPLGPPTTLDASACATTASQPRFALVSRRRPAELAEAEAGVLPNHAPDDAYPVAEVEALRRATSTVQNCALSVLARELDRPTHSRAGDSSLEAVHAVCAAQTPSRHDLEGFMETPEKPAYRWARRSRDRHTHPTRAMATEGNHDTTADDNNDDDYDADGDYARRAMGAPDATTASDTLAVFSPHTLQMERKLYDAVSAMQNAAVAVQERTRQAAEREREYLQAVLFAPPSSSSHES